MTVNALFIVKSFRILASFLFAIGLAHGQPTNASLPSAKETAGIYATSQIPPLKELLVALAPAAAVSVEHDDNNSVHFICAWPEVSVRLTVISNWNGEVERSGIKSWVISSAAVQTNMLAAKPLLGKIDSITGCVGCVITPRFDLEGKAAALVLALAAKLDGYVFTHQAFYDPAGAKLVGVPEAPLKLKAPEKKPTP